MTYLRDPQAIYDASFATIRREANLERWSEPERVVAERIVHACGMVDILDDLVVSTGAVEAGQRAFKSGAPILCDATMVSQGIIGARLPNANDVICLLNDPSVPDRARDQGTTRSAAQVDLWVDKLEGAVVAIGNAPTALFRLLEILSEGAQRPAVVIGMPVGFVGAIESKEQLLSAPIPSITVRGRRGGSAMAAAAVNALSGIA